jgi:hypothetical protein
MSSFTVQSCRPYFSITGTLTVVSEAVVWSGFDLQPPNFEVKLEQKLPQFHSFLRNLFLNVSLSGFNRKIKSNLRL